MNMKLDRNKVLKSLTDYQIELLILLEMNYKIVTGEDYNKKMKVWVENDEREFRNFIVRQDSASKLLELKIMKVHSVSTNQNKITYGKSEFSKEVVANLNGDRVDRLHRKVIEKLKKK